MRQAACLFPGDGSKGCKRNSERLRAGTFYFLGGSQNAGIGDPFDCPFWANQKTTRLDWLQSRVLVISGLLSNAVLGMD